MPYEHDDQGLRIIGYNVPIRFYDPARTLQAEIFLQTDNTLNIGGISASQNIDTTYPTGKLPVSIAKPSPLGDTSFLRYVQLSGNNWARWIPSGGAQSIVGSFNLSGEAFQYKITGRHALSMPGTANLLIGDGAGAALTTGHNLVLAGYQAGAALTDADDSVIIGYQAGLLLASDVTNSTIIGCQAAAYTTNSISNAVIISTTSIGAGQVDDSVIIGEGVMLNADGTAHSYHDVLIGGGVVNVGVGYIGSFNIFIGDIAAQHATELDDNVAIGHQAGHGLTTGSYNAILGSGAAYSLGTGLRNTILGREAGYTLANANDGVYVGYRAGYYETAGSKLFIDNAARASEADGRIKALVYGVFAAATADQYLTVNGHLITADDATFGGFARTSTAIYRRYYHLPLGSANPGASGPTWVPADANTTGGWRLSNASWRLRGQADVHADWDGEDLFVEIHFMINVAGVGAGDTVDLRLNAYYKGDAEAATKTQAVEVPVTVGAAAQYTQFSASFTIDHDAVGAVVDAGDIISFILNLETDTSEVDDIVVTGMEFYYATTHTGIESGDA